MRKATILLFCLFVFRAVPLHAYDYADVVKGITPDGKGVAAAEEFLEYVQTVLKARKTDKEARELFDFVVANTEGLDFSKLYKSDYFVPWDNGFYGVSVQANARPYQMDIELISHEQAREGQARLEGFGSFIAEVALRKNLKPVVAKESDFIYTEGFAQSADQDWMNIVRLLANLCRIIDPENINLLREKRGAPEGKPYDVIQDFKQTFPMIFMDDGVLEMTGECVTRQHQGIPYTDFTMGVGSDPKALKKFFPNVAKYVKRMRGKGSVEIILKNSQGHYIAGFFVKAEKEFFRLHVASAQGKILPMTLSGPLPTEKDAPVFEEAIDLVSLKKYRWKAHVNIQGKASGLRLKVLDSVTLGEYENTGGQMLFSLKMGNIPSAKISGAAYGIVPVGVIDLFIPGTVNGLLRDFNTIMFHANQDEGSLLTVLWQKKEPDRNGFHWKAQTELIDNEFVAIGSRMFAKKFKMDDATIEEFYRMATLAVQVLLNDVRAIR